MYGSPRRFSVAVFAFLLLSVSSAFAQTGTGEIFGRVADRTGAISGDALIQPQSTSSASSGSFRFPNLPIGIYNVTFELGGFKKLIRSDVRIQAGFNAEVNARMELSTVEETVTVTGESPIVD